jgi:hypothetical protein
VAVTLPVDRWTATHRTPGIRLLSSVTAHRQWPRLMPVTRNVVTPMKVRDVLFEYLVLRS